VGRQAERGREERVANQDAGTAPPDGGRGPASYDVDITDDRLVQVLSSGWRTRPGERKLGIWAITGIEIEELTADVRSEPGS
jgi:hypothetical protein